MREWGTVQRYNNPKKSLKRLAKLNLWTEPYKPLTEADISTDFWKTVAAQSAECDCMRLRSILQPSLQTASAQFQIADTCIGDSFTTD